MTGDDFRDIALGMQGAIDRAHMNHPDFRANGRIFATLAADEQSGVVMLSPDEQRECMRQYPKTFFPASGAWDAKDAQQYRWRQPMQARCAAPCCWRGSASPASPPSGATAGRRR